MIQLIAADLDGTLLDSKKQLSLIPAHPSTAKKQYPFCSCKRTAI